MIAHRVSLRRVASAAILFGAGVVHFALAPEHFGEGGLQGASFVVDGLLLVGAAAWLVRSGSAIARLTTSGIAAATALAYVTSRTVGLPVFGHEEWELVGLLTTSAEIASVPLVVLDPRRRGGRALPHVRESVGRSPAGKRNLNQSEGRIRETRCA